MLSEIALRLSPTVNVTNGGRGRGQGTTWLRSRFRSRAGVARRAQCSPGSRPRQVAAIEPDRCARGFEDRIRLIRKALTAGFLRPWAVGMMVLSVTLKRDGHVKEIHPVTSLSPGLDKAAIDTVRSWKFKGCQDEPLCNDGNFKTHLKDLRVQSVFGATCHPRY